MGQSVGEFAARREDEQPLGIEVEAADGDPSTAAQPRQTRKHAGAPVGIVAGDDFALGLVVHQDTRQLAGEVQLDQLAVDPDLVVRPDPLTDVGRLAIDVDAAGGDPLLDFAAGAKPGVGEGLLQLGRISEDRRGRATATASRRRPRYSGVSRPQRGAKRGRLALATDRRIRRGTRRGAGRRVRRAGAHRGLLARTGRRRACRCRRCRTTSCR